MQWWSPPVGFNWQFRNTNTEKVHKYTNTQTHKYTNAKTSVWCSGGAHLSDQVAANQSRIIQPRPPPHFGSIHIQYTPIQYKTISQQDNPAQASTSLHYLIRDKQTQILSPSENIQRRQMFEITRNLQKLQKMDLIRNSSLHVFLSRFPNLPRGSSENGLFRNLLNVSSRPPCLSI